MSIFNESILANIDIGFAFLPAFMGMGFAFEITNATMNFDMDKSKLKQVLSIAVLRNDASQKLLEKIGI